MRSVAIVVLAALLAILAFLGFFSGMNFLMDPSGGTHGMDVSILEGTPVSDFALVGLFFVTAYGVLPIIAIYGLWRLPRGRWTDPLNRWTGQNWAWGMAVVIGAMLIIWIAVEVLLIGSPEGVPRTLQITMASMGAAMIMLTALPSVRRVTRLAA